MAGSSAARRGRTPHDGEMLRAIREAISAATLRPEPEAVGELQAALEPVRRKLEAAKGRAIRWVKAARADKRSRPFAESLMEQFPLDSAQGRALMSLAEALSRVVVAPVGGAGAGGAAGAPIGGAVAQADRPKDNLLLRVGFALLGSVSR